MGIGQAGLLGPAAWPVKAWFSLVKFRPGSGLFLGLFSLTGQAQTFKKKSIRPVKPVKLFF